MDADVPYVRGQYIENDMIIIAIVSPNDYHTIIPLYLSLKYNRYFLFFQTIAVYFSKSFKDIYLIPLAHQYVLEMFYCII